MSNPFRMAAVTIVKDEARYLPEWLAYHILLGCEHFFIFDNGSTDDSQAVLERFINYGYVTRVDWPLFPGQMDAYNYAARVFGHLSEWLTFIDVDEFFVPTRHDSLPACLADVRGDQLLVFWKTFGHSGHRSRPAGLVIENYLRCEEGLSPVTKPVVRSDKIQHVYVHDCVTTTGNTVNDAGAPLQEDWMHPPAQRTEELLRINHYFTRSYEEYAAKIARGQVDGRNIKRLEPYEDFDFAHEDASAAARAEDVKQWLSDFDQLRSQPHRYGAATGIGRFSEPRNFKLYAQNVIGRIAEEYVDARGSVDHFRFGVLASFEDLSAAPRISAAVRERLPEWAAATNGTLRPA